jgi:hypothetical protein
MRAWLDSKLDAITKEFLDGGGYGAVFEAQYIAYLECQEFQSGGPAAAALVWSLFTEVCTEAVTGDEKPTSFSSRITDRQDLVDALKKFRGRFAGPRKSRFVPPAPDQSDDLVRSEDEGEEPLGLFDLLTEDDDE